MGEGEKLILVREQDDGCAGFLKFFLENEGYAVRIASAQEFPTDLEEDPVLAITFWGTTPLGEEHPLYGLSSRAFCSACILRGIPFIVITRWSRAVPEHFMEHAAVVLEKVFDNQDLYQAISKASSGTVSVS